MRIEFMLNDKWIRADVNPGLPLLDFIREQQHLTGTKIGCREGDCGACTVLEGRISGHTLKYRTIVSCPTPVLHARGKHIVTVEGLNIDGLSPVQQALVDHNAAQCGFCTPGFVVSLSAYLMSEDEDLLASISGNICRCTGYKSIERAAKALEEIKKTVHKGNRIEGMIDQGWLPVYFKEIPERLARFSTNVQAGNVVNGGIPIGGGTDLMVQQPDRILEEEILPLEGLFPGQLIRAAGKVMIDGATKIEDFFCHEIIRTSFPSLTEIRPWFASQPIRHMGSLAGNIVNASPIADLVIALLALDAELELSGRDGQKRRVRLREFYTGYKQTILAEGELISQILIDEPDPSPAFHFKKVSKRSYLDIATVNSAIQIQTRANTILTVHLAVGGVAAIPFYAVNTCKCLKGKPLDTNLLIGAHRVLQEEITPIDDIRGSSVYKRLLVRQQFFGHFMHLFPSLFFGEEIRAFLFTNATDHEEH
jgi:xanthine dehydrogenase small subunit